jgi:O-antigen ligase
VLPLLLGLFALLFGFMVASGNWVGAAALLGAVGGLAVVLSGARAVFMLWLVGSPTIFVFLNNYIHVVPVLTMERLLFAVLAAMVVTRVATSKLERLPLSRAERWIVAFLGVAGAAIGPALVNRPLPVVINQDASLYVQAYFMPLATFMLARRLPWTEADVARIARWLLAAGTMLFVTAILQVFFGVMAFVPTYTEVIHSEERATGVFNNGTEFGIAMNAFMLIALLCAVRARDAMLRALLLLLAAAMLAGVLLSETRATWVGLAASFAFLFFADRRLRPYLALCGALAVIVAIVGLPFLLETEVLNRLAGWATAVNLVVHNPLFGVGFERGAFGANIHEYLVGLGSVSAHWATTLAVPHNEHLNVAVLTGLVGFVLYVGVLVNLFAMLRRTCREHASGDLWYDATVYAGAFFTSYLVNGLFVDFGSNIYVGILLFAWMGLVASRSARAERPQVQFPMMSISRA